MGVIWRRRGAGADQPARARGWVVLAGALLLVGLTVAAPLPRPAAAASLTPTAGMDVFATGTDGAVWFKGWDGLGWSAWTSLGGVAVGAPAVASWGPGRIDVFVAGSDQELWHRSFDNGGWSGWQPLGGVLKSSPAVASWAPGRLDILVRGSDDALYHLFWHNGWSQWEALGGALTSAPAAASWAQGRLDVFGRGTDGALHHRFWDGSSWSTWEWLGGGLGSAPAVAAWGSNRLDVFVRGTDGALYHTSWAGAWSPWEWLGGVLTTGPGVATWGPGQLDVFVGGSDSQVWHRQLGSAGWGPWQPRGGVITDAPAATAWTAPANVISSVPYHSQVYSLSCEEAALQMVLARDGVNVSQAQVLQAVTVDGRAGFVDSAGVLHWGNPDRQFVGDVNGSEVALTGYGTYAGPIARVAAAYGLNVLRAGEGIAPGDLYQAIETNHPAVAWISFDYRFHRSGTMVAWDGQVVQYEGPEEHAVTLVGVNQTSVLIDNPWPSLGQQWVSRATFEAAYASYHDMAVVMQ